MQRGTSELLAQTIQLIRNRPRLMTYPVITNATGVSVQFLQDLMTGRIKDQGVIRTEILFKYYDANETAILSTLRFSFYEGHTDAR